MFLEPTWNLRTPSREEAWPILSLRAAARYPHRNNAWLWGGHTLPLGYEAAMPFTGVVLTRPYLLDPKGGRLDLGPGRRVEFLALVPLFPRELDFVRRKDARALLDLAEEVERFEELLVVTMERAPLTKEG